MIFYFALLWAGVTFDKISFVQKKITKMLSKYPDLTVSKIYLQKKEKILIKR